MAKLVIVLALIGIAYWYWSGPYQSSADSPAADATKQNGEIMRRCMTREKHMEAAGELAGIGYVGTTGEEAEKLCADENGLYKMDGKWYPR